VKWPPLISTLSLRRVKRVHSDKRPRFFGGDTPSSVRQQMLMFRRTGFFLFSFEQREKVCAARVMGRVTTPFSLRRLPTLWETFFLFTSCQGDKWFNSPPISHANIGKKLMSAIFRNSFYPTLLQGERTPSPGVSWKSLGLLFPYPSFYIKGVIVRFFPICLREGS